MSTSATTFIMIIKQPVTVAVVPGASMVPIVDVNVAKAVILTELLMVVAQTKLHFSYYNTWFGSS